MENVNNLNGVPNFGHGYEPEAVIPTEEETSTLDEDTDEPKTEEEPKVKAKKK